jgi:riboflavin kinase/FMN adenylyltransferase
VRSILLLRLRVKGVVVGFDFHFGKGRGGTPEFLAGQGGAHRFAVDVIQQQRDGAQAFSSSEIRKALSEGRITEANAMLGYAWFVSGTVQHGEKRGRDLGFPTANLKLDPACGLRHGIYAVRAGVGGKVYDGVASFGRRPTFDNGAPLLETYLFDFSGDLYGQTIDIVFAEFLRPELKFDGIEPLVAQMNEDAANAREALAKTPGAVPLAVRVTENVS